MQGDVEQRVSYGTSEAHHLGEESEPRRQVFVYDQHRFRSVHEPAVFAASNRNFQFQACVIKAGNGN